MQRSEREEDAVILLVSPCVPGPLRELRVGFERHGSLQHIEASSDDSGK